MGVHKATKWEGFPEPAFTINQGRVKVWRLAEIETFEKLYPELTSDLTKSQKQWWFGNHMRSGNYEA